MKIPKKQSDILLSTFLQYQEYVKTLTEDYDQKDLVLNTVKIFYNIENANELPYAQIMDLYHIIDNILSLPQNLIQSFMLNNIEFAINPNFDSMTFGEFIDCNTEDVVQQLCVLYRPVKTRKNGKYLIEDYDADMKYHELFKTQLTLDIYIGFVSFFLKISDSLMKDIQSYLEVQATALGLKKNSTISGAGIVGYQDFVTMT